MPKGNAAFSGITVSEFDDGNALRPEKKNERNNPQPDGHTAIGGDGGNHIEIENGNDEQQHQIAAPECADQMRLSGGLNIAGHNSLERLASLTTEAAVTTWIGAAGRADECVRPRYD